MQQAETKLVGNHRLDRHEMPSPYNYKFPFDQNLQTAGREENRSKKLIIMNSDIVETCPIAPSEGRSVFCRKLWRSLFVDRKLL